MEPSIEQTSIIETVSQNKNVIVNAVAGSGKSTTILFIAKQFPEKRMTQLTYNSQLRHEMNDKVKYEGIENLTIHTYHSLAVRYYSPQAYTDTELRRILRNRISPQNKTKTICDILLIDEAQDMTPLYFHFVLKWIRDNVQGKFQLVILGDEKQGLYEFKGSDTRFLTLAHLIWNSNSQLKTDEFVFHELKTSYRVTYPMASFVNDVMLGEERLFACRDGPPVKYIRKFVVEAQYTMMHMIRSILENRDNKPDDIFILCGSLKNSVRKWENLLVSKNIPCYLPLIEMDGLDERVIRGKVVFSTFHSVKGRQRKFVFVVGFDDSYFDYYARDSPRNQCPNTLYVGCTRATEQLILMEKHNNYEDKPLTFLKKTHSQMKREPYIDFHGQIKAFSWDNAGMKKNKNEYKHYLTPTELIKFIPDDLLESLSASIDSLFVDVTQEREEIPIPVVIETEQGFYEDVSDLNGIVIPFFYVSRETNNPDILFQVVEECIHQLPSGQHEFLKECFTSWSYTGSIADSLFLSNLYAACNEKLYYRLRQIQFHEYNWLSPTIIESCASRIQQVLNNMEHTEFLEMEQTILSAEMTIENERIHNALQSHFPDRRFFFTARVDMITTDVIWEWKCTSHLTIDHFLQVLIYAWIWETIHPEDTREFRLFNIKTGEMHLLTGHASDWQPIVIALLENKYNKPRLADNVSFVENMRRYQPGVCFTANTIGEL